jgi:aminoglycoside 3-N-acetyltransferase
MTEADIIRKTPVPRTIDSLSQDLRQLGLAEGATVIVHSSLSSIGWVCGESVAVIRALMDIVTAEGTIVMPAQTALCDPAHWRYPPVPPEWVEIIRETMPAYDTSITPTRGMGDVAETFRKWPGVLRSAHPNVSLAAWGKNAGFVTTGQTFDFGLGESSPLARVYDLDGQVLMLGTGYDTCTSLHLAEYRVPGGCKYKDGAPIMKDGLRIWQTYEELDMDSDVFPEIGAEFERLAKVNKGRVGSAESRLFRQKEAVDFAVEWLTARRKQPEQSHDRAAEEQEMPLACPQQEPVNLL